MPKKNWLKPWRTERFCIPEDDRARFVARMEDVLDVYQETYDEQHPLICMDEASRQILADKSSPSRCNPGERSGRTTSMFVTAFARC